MATTIAVINKSTLVSDEDARLMTLAIDYQLVKHIAPLSNRGVWHAKFYTKDAVVPAGQLPLVIFDNPDQANALGYHSEDPNGKPFGRVFAKPVLEHGGSAMTGTLSVSAVLSHEACEMFCDKSCNMWIDRMDGTLVALEVCDPVENDAYDVPVVNATGQTIQVSVSNFVLYQWFDAFAPAGTRFDYMKKVTAPLTMSEGGYLIVLDLSTGQVNEVFGSKEAEKLHRQKKPHHPAARTTRRHGHHGKH
jgi:hypothetical protein